ncbi:AMP-binding protein [Actinomadura fibrosa]|uniref:AMP-binding protein n=1 Tax=Actinomadura fibrosa TaxID=111802 RepID=A0ABW2XRY6_9ACTN|nr:AMP-binding protein [Actinomadura fibrosa]
METHPATLWEHLADALGDRPAIIHGATRRTWAEFEHRSALLAGALAARGVGRSAKVGQLLYNTPEFTESYFAALKLRAVPFNINHRYTAPEIAYLLDNADAEALIYHASLRAVVADALTGGTSLKAVIEVDDGTSGPVLAAAEGYETALATAQPADRISRNPDDITMIYTGGTTGMPKGVMFKVGPALDYVLQSVPPLLGHPPQKIDDVPGFAAALGDARLIGLPASPLMHNTGMAMGAMPALNTGGTLVLLEERRFDAAALWDTVERERVTNITIVGDPFARPMLAELRANPGRDLSCLTSIGSSGAMFSAEVKAGLLDCLPHAMIIDLISASEGTMGMSLATAGAPVPTGRFHPSPGVIVVTPEGRRIGAGTEEKGLVALPGGAEGYYKDAEKTAATFKTIDGRRYTLPGDWATVNDDGTLQLLGRGSQCINTAGEKVFAEEVEEALKALPTVEDALVFGVPDERFGQRVAAVISRPEGSTEDTGATIDALRASLAAYKLPRSVIVVARVPRNPAGKADYPAARDLFHAAGTHPHTGRART